MKRDGGLLVDLNDPSINCGDILTWYDYVHLNSSALKTDHSAGAGSAMGGY
jgi:hypothetical protein